MNIIFYSRNCNPSHDLMMSMKNIGILDKFRSYCVDDNLDAVPPHIKNVPTLIVKGINHPMEFDEAVKWLQSIKYIRQCQMADQQRKMILMNMMKQAQMEGPHGFSHGEMGGVSDTFAYTDVDMAQPHSFFNYGDENANTIFTAPEEKTKINKAEQNRIMAEYKASIDKQNDEILLSAKKEQINKMLMMEQQKIAEQNGNI